ncbi:hypothetical protein H5T87_03050 [bacterium]|nr:hypothetical protein [bacterium]
MVSGGSGEEIVVVDGSGVAGLVVGEDLEALEVVQVEAEALQEAGDYNWEVISLGGENRFA